MRLFDYFQAATVWYDKYALKHAPKKNSREIFHPPPLNLQERTRDRLSLGGLSEHTDYSEFNRVRSERSSLADSELDKNVASLVNDFFRDLDRDVKVVVTCFFLFFLEGFITLSGDFFGKDLLFFF